MIGERHHRTDLVILVLGIRWAHSERHGQCAHSEVLVVALGMYTLAGRGEHEVAVEAVCPAGLSCGHLDVVGEGREVAGRDNILGVRCVRG